MKISTFLSFGLGLAALPALAGPPASTPAVVQPPQASGIEFVANRQQWEKPVLFAADVPSGRLFMERGRLVQALYDAKQLDEMHERSAVVPNGQLVRAHAYATTFVGGNMQTAVRGEAKLPGFSNYFIGNDPARWASEVPGYEGVRYKDLYPGIDLRFYSKARVLEYDFELAAGADAKRIVLRYDGQTGLRVVDGALHIGTSVGTVVEQRPYAYQVVNGQQRRVRCDYSLMGGNTLTFSLPNDYDHALPLVIDPVLVYSSYTNSSSNYGYTAAYDSVGNLYAGGTVFGPGYPTTMGAFQVNYNNSTDMGIIKYDPRAATGPASRVYATYVGGNSDDHPHSLVVDRGNNLIIMGSTGSSNYPVTATGYARTFGGGGSDIVITKLNPAGSALVGSTYLGGSGTDGRVPSGALNVNYGDTYRGDITIDRSNNIYIASVTESNNYPTTTGVFQPATRGGADAVISKLNPSLTSLTWSSYLGGMSADVAYSIQLDSLNNVFVSGGTASTNLQGTTGAFHSSSQGGSADGFVSRISADGSTLVRTSYIGTSAYDQGHFLQLNKQGEVYVFGQTFGNYPVTPGIYNNAGSRQFIQKLDPQLTTSLFSTVIGNGTGSGANMSPTAFLVDNCGQIMLSGWTSQGGMAVTPDALQTTGGSGNSSNGISAYFYIAQLSANGQRLVYGTYFGNGSCHVDGGTSRFDKRGIIYQSMCTGSGNNPIITTPNAWSAVNGSSYNNAAFKIDVAQLNADFFSSIIQTPLASLTVKRLCAPARFYFNRPTVGGTGTRWDFGNGQTSTQATGASALYTQPGKYAVRLTVFDSTNCVQSSFSVDTVEVLGLPRAAAGPDQSVCAGSSATITVVNAGAGATYRWSPATGLNTATGRTVVATPTVTTTYIVTVDLPGTINCTGTDTVTVTVRAPLAVTAGANREVCAGASTTLVAPDFGPGTTYRWSPATGLSAPTGRTVVATPTVTTLYTLDVIDSNGCVGQSSVRVDVAPAPTVAVAASQPNLTGMPVRFTNTTTGATRYRWDFGDGSPVSTEDAPTHIYTVTGKTVFPAKVTAFYGANGSCEETVNVPVEVRAVDLPNIITPNGDQLNDTFRPFVSLEPVSIQMFNRWGRLVFEQSNYVDGWGGKDVPPGIYYYHLRNASGETWKGWLEVAY